MTGCCSPRRMDGAASMKSSPLPRALAHGAFVCLSFRCSTGPTNAPSRARCWQLRAAAGVRRTFQMPEPASRCSPGSSSTARPIAPSAASGKSILVSALDEELDRIDARYGIDVFWKAFLSTRGGYRVGIPRVPLGDLYDGCKEAIRARGGEVILRAGVRGFPGDGTASKASRGTMVGGNGGLLSGGGASRRFARTAAADVVEREPVFSNLRKLRTSPITGVHLWFDGAVMHEPFPHAGRQHDAVGIQ